MATDKVLSEAVACARSAAQEVAEAGVGEHLGFYLEGERIGTHRFASLAPGYVGWHWAVTLARAPRARTATVCEVDLVPGASAVLAPRWVPWAERLRPGDLTSGDTLPYQSGDGRLMAGYEQTDDAEADRVAIYELGLGRARVLSPEGRDAAFTRWYDGEYGPYAESARKAQEHCTSCGFLMKLEGAARLQFGVCANEWSPADGRVVALNHGCGAHSETDAPGPGGEWQQGPPVIDELDLEIVASAAGEAVATPAGEPEGTS